MAVAQKRVVPRPSPAQTTKTGLCSRMKYVSILAILLVLSMVVMLSYTFSQERVQRIACMHNQDAMRDALMAFEADNAGQHPRKMRGLRNYYLAADEDFGRCPVNPLDTYAYDPTTGEVTCPNLAHRLNR